jgi:hypothetical protein
MTNPGTRTPHDNLCRENNPTKANTKQTPLWNATASELENSTLFHRKCILLFQSFGTLLVSVVLKLARLDVTRQHFALKVFLVAVPEQRCFSVKR